MGWDSDVLMLVVSLRRDGCMEMDSERALESSRCSSGWGMVSPVASAARCCAAGIRGLAGVVEEQGHQRTWSAYVRWRSRRARTTSGSCRESGAYKTGQPGEGWVRDDGGGGAVPRWPYFMRLYSLVWCWEARGASFWGQRDRQGRGERVHLESPSVRGSGFCRWRGHGRRVHRYSGNVITPHLTPFRCPLFSVHSL
jgi:hypothetical protein